MASRRTRDTRRVPAGGDGVPSEAATAAKEGEAGAAPRRRFWRHRAFWFQWLLTGGIIALIAWRMDLREAWSQVRQLQPGWLVAGVVLLTLSNVVHAIKWQKLLQCVGKAPLIDLFAVFWSSMATNNVIPFRAGDVLRVQLLAQRTGLRRSGVVATLVTERILDGVSFLIILIAAFALLSGGDSRFYLASFVLALVVALALLATVWATHFDAESDIEQRRLLRRLPLRVRKPLHAVLPDFVEGLRPLGSLGMGLEAAAWALAAWVLEALAYVAFGWAFQLDIPFGAYLLVMVAVNFAGSLTVLPSNLGIYEFAAIEILRSTGATAGEATAYAFGSHLLVIATISGIGLVTLAYLRIGPGDIFYLRQRAALADGASGPETPGDAVGTKKAPLR